MEPTHIPNSAQEKFESYLSQTSKKEDPKKRILLRKNKLKSYQKAFAPVTSTLPAGAKVLDYGCGSGDFLFYLSQLNKNLDLYGYDVSQEQVQAARSHYQSTTNIQWLDNPPKNAELFDFIFCHHVIEHVPDEQVTSFLQNLKSLLKPGGNLVLTTPNGLNPFSYTLFMAMDSTHLRMYSVFSLAEVLSKAQLKIDSYHRELPQFYDVPTFFKFLVWKTMSTFAKLAILSHAGGVRGNAFPMDMASTFYVVVKKENTSSEYFS